MDHLEISLPAGPHAERETLSTSTNPRTNQGAPIRQTVKNFFVCSMAEGAPSIGTGL
jgi:hypothetical protein